MNMPAVNYVQFSADLLVNASVQCYLSLKFIGMTILACSLVTFSSHAMAADQTPRIKQMQKAIVEENLPTVKSLLDQGFDPNLVKTGVVSPLFAAIKQGNPDIVSLLVSRGADVNSVENTRAKNSALHIATKQGNDQILRVLLNNGASIDPIDYKGQTPLFTAISANVAVDMINTLVESGADVNRLSKTGLSPLEFAVSFGGGKYFETLEAAGAIMRVAQLAENMCDRCHSKNGPGIASIKSNPHLASQHAGYISKQLIDFREKQRQSSKMDAAVKSMPDSVVAALSEYYESQSSPKPPLKSDLERYVRGEHIYNEKVYFLGLPACAGCHGVNGEGVRESNIPRVANLHSDHVEMQLKSFNSGKRSNDPHQVMRLVAENLSAQEMSDVSLYISEMQ